MKSFRLTDTSFLALFEKPNLYKVATISVLLRKFPKRKFLLIGDTGEKDPEAYAEVHLIFFGF
jgi:phosphatidate phosphatase APP1